MFKQILKKLTKIISSGSFTAESDPVNNTINNPELVVVIHLNTKHPEYTRTLEFLRNIQNDIPGLITYSSGL